MKYSKNVNLIKSLSFCFFFLVVVSCGPFVAPLSKTQSQEFPWEKRHWLEKTQRLLLYGEVLDETQQAELAATKSKEEIVDFLFSDSRFYDAVLDFNYYFLNLKVNKVYEPSFGGRNYLFYRRVTPPLSAARALARGGSYFELFEHSQPNFYEGNQPPCKKQAIGDEVGCAEKYPEGSSKDEVMEARKKWSTLAYTAYLKSIQEISSLPESSDNSELCNSVYKNIYDFTTYLEMAGFDGQGGSPIDTIRDQLNRVLNLCFINPEWITKSRLLDVLNENLPLAEKMTHDLLFDPGVNKKNEQILSELNDLDLAKYGFQKNGRYDFYSFWINFQNSSTNFNRRRGAYILKTYFCDDLTPIDVALPSDHTKGKHGSDPSCASCHYKLDPMAGFFRNHSTNIDYTNLPYLRFDDGKILNQADKDLYLSSWKNPPGSDRVWNVGYIRSARDKNLNRYGETLEDLSNIIKEAPEVKQCLTRRMAEYFLGRDQVFDGGWLRELSQKFEDASKSKAPDASSLAFKQVAKELLLSKTFSTRNPDPSKCYDFKKGSEETAVPCEVAFNIENNCASCHKGSGAARGLDLTNWTVDENGKGVFSHRDESGKQLAAEVSFQRILESLSTQDERKLMPYFKSMAPVERAQLFKWVEGELNR
jgi:hypothetical protein